MKIQLIRNATMKITLAGKTVLTDPMLLPRQGFESFAGKEKNPVVDLPLPVEEILKGVDMVLISHVHPDHFDDRARQLLPKNIPVLCPPGYAAEIQKEGFSNITSVHDTIEWEGIRITLTPGRHAGSEKWREILGPVAGFLLRAKKEPSLYWPGDTILYEAVETLIREEQPDIILPHGCGAMLQDSGPIVMDAGMVVDICGIAPAAKVAAIHMEALDHATVSREDLRRTAYRAGISETQLIIPEDGDILRLD